MLFATVVIVWRVAASKADLVKMIHGLDIKVVAIDTKTQDVKEDHDRLVLVEAATSAMHERFDDFKKHQNERVCNE